MGLGLFEELATTAVADLDDAELLADLRSAVELQRRLEAVIRDRVAEVDDRNLAFDHACPSTAVLLRGALRVPPGEARAMVKNARACGPRRNLQGEALDPIFAQAAAAQDAGEISREQANIVVDTVGKIPSALQAEWDLTVEADMTEHAGNFDAKELRKIGRKIIASLDQDGTLREDKDRERQRGVDLRKRADGSSRIEGELTPEATELLELLFDAHAAPKTTDGQRDLRSPAQRRHDALAEGIRAMLRTASMPSVGGVTASIVLHMDAADYVNKCGFATTARGTTVRVPDALWWANTDAELFGVLFAKGGRVAAYSTGKRLFDPDQRRAIWARDKGCTFPGCDTPPSWCEVHHVSEHQDGGPTAVDNAALVCRYHHSHFKELGWRSIIDEGIPKWIPPAWIDPLQKPRTNPMNG